MPTVRRHLHWLALGAALIGLHLAVTTLAQRAVREAISPGPLMPAAGGPIELLAIQFHRGGERPFLDVFAELLGALDPDTRVLVTVTDEADRALFDEQMRARLAEPPVLEYTLAGHPITSWARDRLLVLLPDRGPTTLVAPPRPMPGDVARANDWRVPWTLQRTLMGDTRVRTAAFSFEGGDLIADEQHVYAATPLAARYPDEPEPWLAVEDLAGLPLVRIGGPDEPVPDHHIGMFLTPIGDGRVLWGSPDLARDRVDADTEVGGLPLQARFDRVGDFENVEAALIRAGLEPIALPLVPTDQAHVMVSYNNALMERRDGRLHVYMPVYGLDELDAMARGIYEAQGAIVHPVHVEHIFRMGGSVRCLTAPLVRGTPTWTAT